MPNREQYKKQSDAKKLRALAEYEKRKKQGESRLCERCIRLEQTKRNREKPKIKLEIKDVIVRWD